MYKQDLDNDLLILFRCYMRENIFALWFVTLIRNSKKKVFMF